MNMRRPKRTKAREDPWVVCWTFCASASEACIFFISSVGLRWFSSSFPSDAHLFLGICLNPRCSTKSPLSQGSNRTLLLQQKSPFSFWTHSLLQMSLAKIRWLVPQWHTHTLFHLCFFFLTIIDKWSEIYLLSSLHSLGNHSFSHSGFPQHYLCMRSATKILIDLRQVGGPKSVETIGWGGIVPSSFRSYSWNMGGSLSPHWRCSFPSSLSLYPRLSHSSFPRALF